MLECPVVDVDQGASIEGDLFYSGRKDPTAKLRRSPMLKDAIEMEDIVVLGGLAAFFCWTYIVVPLGFYHG
jgi:hypothetical protein